MLRNVATLVVLALVAVQVQPRPSPQQGIPAIAPDWITGTTKGATFLALSLDQRALYVAGVLDGMLMAPMLGYAMRPQWLECSVTHFGVGGIAARSAAVVEERRLRRKPATFAVWVAVTELPEHCRHL